MKRLNPKTGVPFVLGDVREDGFIFCRYVEGRGPRKCGTFTESWRDPEGYFRDRVTRVHDHAKMRAKEEGLPFDVDVEYLLSIFPPDALCPILKTPMSFGGERRTSPSLDKRVPEKGYTRGNICWISFKANVVKQDITDPEFFLAIAAYVRDCTTQHTSNLNNG
jgi:hypothetical protein